MLISLLEKIDIELEREAKLYIIGGSAACLAYNAKNATKDIDTWNIEKAIENAYEIVIKKYPELKIPLSPVHVHIDSPEMLSRFRVYKIVNLKKLVVLMPEAEDLFLMKAQRADEKDLVDLVNLSKLKKINSDFLLHRFKNELLPLNAGNDELLIENYLVCIERVFGERVAELHQKTCLKA